MTGSAQQSSLYKPFLSDIPIINNQDSIISVHGLDGHRETSWTAANGVNWLHDLLPCDIPDTRVLSWGYSLPTAENIHETLSQQKVSEQLVRDLWEIRSSTNARTQLTQHDNKN